MVTQLLETKYVKVFDRNGWIYASRKGMDENISRPDAVVIIAQHVESQKLVVISQYRPPIDAVQFEFPAGLIDKGETPEEAAKRELFEETGLTIERIVSVVPCTHPSSGLSNECVSLVIAEVSGEPTNANNDGSENIKTHLMDENEILSLESKCVDSKLGLIVALGLAARRG